MSKVEWIDAPDWATAYGNHKQFPDIYYWLSDEGYMPTHDSACLPYAQTYNHSEDQFTIIEYRQSPTFKHEVNTPLPETTWSKLVWDGEGLPPVGTECELYNCGQCHVGEIVYISDVYTIMKIDGQGEQHFHSSGLQFKRLKTEYDKTVDMICSVLSNSYADITEVVKGMSHYRHYAESLIEAGYRKHASLNRDFSTGDTYNTDVNHWTAGIHIPGHMNAIEVYAGTQEGAELLRDEILERISC